MRRENDKQTLFRKTRFESFEERLTFTAQPIAELPYLASQVTSNLDSPAADISTMAVNNSATPTTTSTAPIGGFDGKGQTVAVIDSGIAYDQYALGHGIGTGYHVVGGWNFADNNSNIYDKGPAGFHGTFVSGIIGSTDSAHLGVAPGADLVGLRVFDDNGNSNFAWIDSALKWVHNNRNAFANPITTVNLSIGTTWNANTVPNWATLEADLQQLKSDGIFIAVAAGNSFASYNMPGLSYPAVSPYVVPVASVGASGQLSSFSQRNSRVIAAPGENITSTVPDALHGVTNNFRQFDTASGTSMAAPYVAGASVLIRQAMQAAGYKNINEDMIYSQMQKTADSVFDSVTNSTYLRLNLDRAIQSLIPLDHPGSAANTAVSLGSFGASGTFKGTINYAGDANYYSFTAGQTGTIALKASHATSVTTSWQLVGNTTATTGDNITFDVVAGKTYTVGLIGKTGTGAFSVNYNNVPKVTQPLAIDWGTIAFSQINNQSLKSSDNWFQFRASRDGILTVDAAFKNSAGNLNLELYDANRQLLGASNTTADAERIDVNGKAGQVYYVHVTGTNSQVNFRVTDLVVAQGATVNVYSGSGDNTFTFVAGSQNQLTINGVSYSFNNSTVTNYLMHGGTGNDTANWTGTTNSDQVKLQAGAGELRSGNLLVTGDSIKNFRVNGGGGNDSVSFIDNVGGAQFVSRPNAAQMTGSGFADYATKFNQVSATAKAGSNDVATLYDTAAADTLTANASSTTLTGGGFQIRVDGFSKTIAYSTSGYDTATLYGTVGNNRFESHLDYASMTGSGYSNEVRGFKNVVANAGASGTYTAAFYDSHNNDTLLVSTTSVSLYGNGYNNRAVGFKTVEATSTGTNNKAIFSDMGSGDKFVGQGNTATWQGTKITAKATGFNSVSARTTSISPLTAELSAVDFLLEQVGNWRTVKSSVR